MAQQYRAPSDLLSMKVDELLARWPTAAQVFIAYRLACVGCDFAGFHTTQQVLDVYGLEPSPFVEELRRVVDRHANRTTSSAEQSE